MNTLLFNLYSSVLFNLFNNTDIFGENICRLFDNTFTKLFAQEAMIHNWIDTLHQVASDILYDLFERNILSNSECDTLVLQHQAVSFICCWILARLDISIVTNYLFQIICVKLSLGNVNLNKIVTELFWNRQFIIIIY